VGRKIAEGGQAEIFKWLNQNDNGTTLAQSAKAMAAGNAPPNSYVIQIIGPHLFNIWCKDIGDICTRILILECKAMSIKVYEPSHMTWPWRSLR
jgi:hypothetical protein